MSFKQQRAGGPSPSFRGVLLALCFLCGIFLGQVLAGHISAGAEQELSDYLRTFAALDEPFTVHAVLSAAWLYLRDPLLAALLGSASVGVVLLPALTAMFGFFLSFSVSCFTAVFGQNGVLLALAALGPRCLITLPCYFLLAVPAWGSSAALARRSFGRGRRTAPAVYGTGWWTRVGVCCLILLAGVCIELFCVPPLLHRALDHMF